MKRLVCFAALLAVSIAKPFDFIGGAKDAARTFIGNTYVPIRVKTSSNSRFYPSVKSEISVSPTISVDPNLPITTLGISENKEQLEVIDYPVYYNISSYVRKCGKQYVDEYIVKNVAEEQNFALGPSVNLVAEGPTVAQALSTQTIIKSDSAESLDLRNSITETEPGFTKVSYSVNSVPEDTTDAGVLTTVQIEKETLPEIVPEATTISIETIDQTVKNTGDEKRTTTDSTILATTEPYSINLITDIATEAQVAYTAETIEEFIDPTSIIQIDTIAPTLRDEEKFETTTIEIEATTPLFLGFDRSEEVTSIENESIVPELSSEDDYLTTVANEFKSTFVQTTQGMAETFTEAVTKYPQPQLTELRTVDIVTGSPTILDEKSIENNTPFQTTTPMALVDQGANDDNETAISEALCKHESPVKVKKVVHSPILTALKKRISSSSAIITHVPKTAKNPVLSFLSSILNKNSTDEEAISSQRKPLRRLITFAALDRSKTSRSMNNFLDYLRSLRK